MSNLTSYLCTLYGILRLGKLSPCQLDLWLLYILLRDKTEVRCCLSIPTHTLAGYHKLDLILLSQFGTDLTRSCSSNSLELVEAEESEADSPIKISCYYNEDLREKLNYLEESFDPVA